MSNVYMNNDHDDLELQIFVFQSWNSKWHVRLGYDIHHPEIQLNRKYRIGRLLPILHNMSAEDEKTPFIKMRWVELTAKVRDLRKVFLQRRYHKYLYAAIQEELRKQGAC